MAARISYFGTPYGDVPRIGPLLSRHQTQSPVFSGLPEQTAGEVRADVVDDFANEGVANLIYEEDSRIVGNFFVCPIELSSAHSGLALTDASFAWARREGYDVMTTDWRVTNLLSSRFWPRRGFRTTFLRLHRFVAH